MLVCVQRYVLAYTIGLYICYVMLYIYSKDLLCINGNVLSIRYDDTNMVTYLVYIVTGQKLIPIGVLEIVIWCIDCEFVNTKLHLEIKCPS